MKIMIVAVGRLKSGPERDLAQRYQERFAALSKQLGLGGPVITEFAESPARSAEQRKSDEAASILSALPSDALVVRLDERAPPLDSAAFAELIRVHRDQGRKTCAFVIGGADGLAPEIASRAQAAVSFGRMTLPHQLVRVLLSEQIYRAATILSGHPYHRV